MLCSTVANIEQEDCVMKGINDLYYGERIVVDSTRAGTLDPVNKLI